MNRQLADYQKDKRVDKIISKGQSYWNALIQAEDRTILSKQQKELVDNIVKSLTAHKHTQKHLRLDEGCYQLCQLPIYFNYKDISCKALLDLVTIDTNNKTIQPIDVKTIGDNPKRFVHNAKRFRYDIQAAWYTLAVEHLRSVDINSVISIDLTDYQILPFKFLVESTVTPGICPLVYTCTEDDIFIGRCGAIAKSTVIRLNYNKKQIVPVREIHGFEEAISRYKYYKNTSPEYDKYIADVDGQLTLGLWNK